MSLAILATVISALELMKDSEVMKLVDHDLAHGILKVRQGMIDLHYKLHHKKKSGQ